jgi:gamma-glutamyltranspeptidase/glutathione hydrolase
MRRLDSPPLVFPLLIFWAVFLSLAAASPAITPQKASSPPADRHTPYDFVGQKGMVVAAHPLAAEAGLDILKQGGNAVDAAVATAFALNVVEPFASGLGGGGFMVIYLAGEKRVRVLNFREKAPAAITSRTFMKGEEPDDSLRGDHGLAVGVPGALAGWEEAVRKFGTLSLAKLAEKAILYAEEGFVISPTFSKINKDEYEKILKNSGENSIYLNQGFPYEPGDTLKNPQLARMLRQIAAEGTDVFYKGAVAEKIAAAVRAKGGVMTTGDLADFRVLEQDPVRGEYKGLSIFTIQPPGSGGIHIIQLLNVCSGWDLKKWGHNTPAYIHHISEALRFVFSDRSRYLGDPSFVDVPVGALISPSRAAEIRGSIKPDKVAGTYAPGEFGEDIHAKENTTHLCTVDRWGNIVALTQSINDFFGTGIVPEGTGFLLNNHMDDFSRDPDSANAPGGGKRPVSSMGPMIMLKGDIPYLTLGSPGGTRIFSSLTQIILNITEFGMSLDEAIEAPRFFSYSAGGRARDIHVESRIPGTVINQLEILGHTVTIREAYDKYFGGAQGILIRKGNIFGGADSRRDGSGAGY